MLDGAKILRETWEVDDVVNSIVPLYDNEDSVCGIEYNGTAYYFLKNLQGDIIAITDNSGEEVARYSYDAWGVCTVTKDISNCDIANINPFRYRFYYFDLESGLYYLQSRYYDAQVGRFVNGDEAVFLGANASLIGYNIIAYCDNNPVNLIDAIGNFGTPIQWAMAAIGGLVGVYFGDYVARRLGYKKGWKYWAIRTGVIVGGAAIGWFTGSVMISIVKTFLLSTPGTLLRLPRWIVDFFGLRATYNVIVIGETMTRVISYARTIGASVYLGMEFYDDLEAGFGKKIAKLIGGIHNAVWIIKRMIEKYHIVDIGIDSNRATRSPYYLMESILTFFYRYKTLLKKFLG